jgi:hypothetical protein
VERLFFLDTKFYGEKYLDLKVKWAATKIVFIIKIFI